MNIQFISLRKASVTFMDDIESQLNLLDPYRKQDVRLGLTYLRFDADNEKHCYLVIKALLEASKKQSEVLFKMIIDSNYALLEHILLQHGKNLQDQVIWFSKRSVERIFDYFPHIKLGLKLL